MKKLLTLIIAMVGIVVISVSAEAQTIIWGAAQNMVGDSDVLNTGVYLDAATFYTSAVTVNGVTFNPTSAGLTGTDGIDISISSGGSGAYPSFTTVSPSSVDYSHAVSSIGYIWFSDGTNLSGGTVTISNLTVGQTYRVQAWVRDSADPAAAVTTSFTGTTPVTLSDPSDGQYAIGTFTASSNSERFGYSITGGGYAIINAVSVFATTPEPSSVALVSVAAMVLAFQFGRKRRSSI